MSKSPVNDKELIARYLDGDEKSFELLLNKHKEKIYTSIYLFVKDHERANDIFQDVFIKIVKTLRAGKYNHEGKFKQWAMRIAYNMCVDNFRKNKRRSIIQPTDDFDIFDIIESGDANREDSLIREQTYSKVRKLVDNLPPEQREVVILRHYADMSFKEIAAMTRVSINTALGRMRYALINMRKMVDNKEVVFS
jgi:RNA polymerase sigma-70 factor (ECF subfamily)